MTSAHPLHRRRLPRAVSHLRLRHVEPQGQFERPGLWCGEPVALLVRARRLALDVERQRSVRAERALTAVAERIAVDRVVDQVGILVVERQRPEGVDGWNL